jgi:acetyl esterase/lipase
MHRPIRLDPRSFHPLVMHGARAVAAAASVAVLLVSACAAPPPTPGMVPDPAPGAKFVENGWGTHLATSPNDVAYGPEEHQHLDVLPATGPRRRGTIVFVHGGGFVAGHRSHLLDGQHGAIVHQRSRGWDIATVGYLVGPSTFPQGYHDVALAVAWVREHGESVGLDTTRIVLAGHSAGGSLTAMVATTPGDPTPYGPVPRVDAWVSVAGLHDWGPAGVYIGDPWGIPSGARSQVSPVNTLDRSDPPGYLIHADRDPIVRPVHSQLLHERAVATGADVRFDLVDTGPGACRLHTPLCGANLSSFNAFLS